VTHITVCGRRFSYDGYNYTPIAMGMRTRGNGGNRYVTKSAEWDVVGRDERFSTWNVLHLAGWPVVPRGNATRDWSPSDSMIEWTRWREAIRGCGSPRLVVIP